MQYYHKLVYGDYKDLKTLWIPPASVPDIQKKMSNNEPIHLTGAGTVVPSQIRSFEPSDKPFNPQPLLDAVAGAFNEPVINEDGSIACRWVRKEVTSHQWDKHYGPIGYKRLGDTVGMVSVAMFMPIHQIDTAKMQYCTDAEISKLTRK